MSTFAAPAPEQTHPAAEDTPRPAASVVLLRDSPAGLEVLLLRRAGGARELGGVYVFPGGKVDPDDADERWRGWLGADDTTLRARLGEPGLDAALARALYVAAARELREEAGVALPEAQTLRPWARWITPRNPVVGAQRFDTRFFLARLPAGAEVQRDTFETTAALWITPQQALQRYWARELELIPPQLMGLAHLARHATVDSVWDEAGRRMPPCVEPVQFRDGEHRAMCYPGDPQHPVRERALPGPTRLRLVDGRFEPYDGWQGWWA